MCQVRLSRYVRVLAFIFILSCVACTNTRQTAKAEVPEPQSAPLYIIGPGDELKVFVWGNPDLSVTLPVRPDGRITTPLVEDIEASGKTPTLLAREIEGQLKKYINNPRVTVTVTQFVGRNNEQIRVVGEAANPQSLPYKANMTLIDVLIKVGGLTEYAAGNKATIIRTIGDQQRKIHARLNDLLKDGDMSANITMMPGDILVIPESWF